MAISADVLINITNNVLNPSGNNRSFSGLMLTINDNIPTSNRVLSFPTLQSVSDYFGPLSDEYAAAPYYFNSFLNAQKNVDPFLIGKYIDEDISPWIKGGKVTSTVLQFKAVTSGTISIILDGTLVNATGIDLSSSNSYSDVGVHVQQGLRDASPDFPNLTVVYNPFYNAYIINTNETGAGHTIGYPNLSPLVNMIKLNQADGAVLSQGANAQSPIENMDAILLEQNNWAAFTPLFADAGLSIEFAKWASDHKFFTYCSWDETLQGALDFNTAINTASYAGINVNKGDQSTALFSMAVGASIDFERTNGLASWAAKQQTGLPPTVTTDEDATTLLDAEVNFYGEFSTVSTGFKFYEYGTISGPYKYMDNFYGFLWLRDVIQTATAELMANTLRIPSSERGYSLVRNTISSVMTKALNNGVCETGFVLDQQAKAILAQQVGFDVSNEITNNGYYIQIIPQTLQEKANRTALKVNLWYANNGSVQRFDDNITVII